MILWHWTDVHKVALPQDICSGGFLQNKMLAVAGRVCGPGFHCTTKLGLALAEEWTAADWDTSPSGDRTATDRRHGLCLNPIWDPAAWLPSPVVILHTASWHHLSVDLHYLRKTTQRQRFQTLHQFALPHIPSSKPQRQSVWKLVTFLFWFHKCLPYTEGPFWLYSTQSYWFFLKIRSLP